MKPATILKAAHARLAEIWDYTVEKWGETQADEYLRGLAACVEHLPKRRSTWRRVPRLPDVFCVRWRHHFLFFREQADHIAVISILHENMDIPVRLREDAKETP